MRKRLIIALLLLTSPLAWAQITRDGNCSANLTSCTFSATSLSYATITMTKTDNTSWVAGLAGGSAQAGCTPSGMTVVSSTGTLAIVSDTNATITGWSTTACTLGGTSNTFTSVVEILRAAVAGGVRKRVTVKTE